MCVLAESAIEVWGFLEIIIIIVITIIFALLFLDKRGGVSVITFQNFILLGCVVLGLRTIAGSIRDRALTLMSSVGMGLYLATLHWLARTIRASMMMCLITTVACLE